ncbi:MAG: GerMN domain-containing protein [Candidatus Acidiferrales bacterium]
MSRRWIVAALILAVLVVFGVREFSGLRRHVSRLKTEGPTEAQARRDVVAPQISTPSDTLVPAQMFWLAPGSTDTLSQSTVQISLSSDATQRAKQVIAALIGDAPNPAQRTLPADTTLLQFYILPDGTAIADFSDELASETPSGILSEQLVVNSITSTLAANVPSIARLKILIHGQEADTLAGHVDLTGFFPLNTPPAPPSITTIAVPVNRQVPTAAPGGAAAPPAAGRP